MEVWSAGTSQLSTLYSSSVVCLFFYFGHDVFASPVLIVLLLC